MCWSSNTCRTSWKLPAVASTSGPTYIFWCIARYHHPHVYAVTCKLISHDYGLLSGRVVLVHVPLC